MDKTAKEVMDVFWEVFNKTKKGYNSEVKIVLSWRYPNKIVPIYRTYVNYQKVGEEIKVEEED